MTQSIGWWEWCSEDDAMTIASTGERIANLGPFDPPSELELFGHHWLLFEYRHGDVRYPLLVQSGSFAPIDSFAPKDTRTKPWIHLRLDHIASARFWARQSTLPSEFPPFSLWDRVDELMVDAIACWPTDLIDAFRPYRLFVNGGWHNGEWTRDYLRRFNQFRGHDFPRDEDVVISNWGAPAGTAPVWRYVHVDGPTRGFDLTAETICDRRQTDRTSKWPDMEVSVPHLARKPGGAVLFPSRAYVSRQHPLVYGQCGEPPAKGLFRYADDDVSCLFSGNVPWPPGDALRPSNPAAAENRRYLQEQGSDPSLLPRFHDGAPRPWQFSVAVTDHGYTRPGGVSDLSDAYDLLGTARPDSALKREHLDWYAPELGLWRRLRDAILEAWLAWPGRMTGLVAEEEPEAVREYKCHNSGTLLELPLPSASQVSVSGAYVGGRWMPGAGVVATCLPDWRIDWKGPTLLELIDSPGGPALPLGLRRPKKSRVR